MPLRPGGHVDDDLADVVLGKEGCLGLGKPFHRTRSRPGGDGFRHFRCSARRRETRLPAYRSNAASGCAMAPDVAWRPPRSKDGIRWGSSAPPTTSMTQSIAPGQGCADGCFECVRLSGDDGIGSFRISPAFVAPVRATTRAPRHFTSWIAAVPAPPDAPVTRTHSSGCGRACRTMPSAVKKATIKLASSTSERPLLTGTTSTAGQTA